MAIYIPYVVGTSTLAYVTKGLYTYFTSDTEEIVPTKSDEVSNNSFLKEYTIESELEILKEGAPEKSVEDETKDEIPFPELIEYRIPPVIKKKVTIMDPIKEVNEDGEDINGCSKTHYTCVKCEAKLPVKCFSKTQRKKPVHTWKCKVCIKLL